MSFFAGREDGAAPLPGCSLGSRKLSSRARRRAAFKHARQPVHDARLPRATAAARASQPTRKIVPCRTPPAARGVGLPV